MNNKSISQKNVIGSKKAKHLNAGIQPNTFQTFENMHLQ